MAQFVPAAYTMTEICGREGIEALASGLPSDDEDLKDGAALRGPLLPGEAVSQDEIDKLFGLSG